MGGGRNEEPPNSSAPTVENDRTTVDVFFKGALFRVGYIRAPGSSASRKLPGRAQRPSA